MTVSEIQSASDSGTGVPGNRTPLWQTVAMLLIAAMSALRFVGLESSPAGFHLDEAAGAANIICVADEGRGEQGGRLPLFFPEFPGTGTFFTPTYIYSGVIWAKIFDTSIASFRAHVAFYGVITIAGIFILARKFTDRGGALLAALAAAVSPWSFHYARIAWDPGLMPAFIVLGLLTYFGRSRWSAAGSGLLLAAAMYTYPTARLLVPALLPLLAAILWTRAESEGIIRKERLVFISIQAAVLVLAVIPLAVLTFDGSLTSRAASIAITNPDWLMSAYGDASPRTMLLAFLRHVASHLSPEFLLFRGDANIRHGSQLVGQLSPVDLFALAAGVITLLPLGRRRSSGHQSTRQHSWFALLAAYGFFIAIAVSSLTWEGVPHATRSLAAWPFVSLLSGLLLWRASHRWRFLPHLAVVTALFFSALFASDYFGRYARVSEAAFDSALKTEAELAKTTADWEQLEWFATFYPEPAMRYYFMHYRGLSCSESQALLQRLR